MASDKVTVPEGHKVVVITPTSNSHVSTLESGVIVVDYGGVGEDWRKNQNEIVDSLEPPPSSMLVIVQNQMIEHLKNSNEISNFFEYWKSLKKNGISAVWVLPFNASSQFQVVSKIHEIGYGVHSSAPDGACFIEVHKPDGSITVGMLGEAL